MAEGVRRGVRVLDPQPTVQGPTPHEGQLMTDTTPIGLLVTLAVIAWVALAIVCHVQKQQGE